VKIMAIVKANAYGHGLEIITRAALESSEVYAFGVATEEEGVRLRKLTSRPILVLTTVLDDELEVVLKNDLDVTLTEFSSIQTIAAKARVLGKRAQVHLKVDTGMRRVGVRPEETLQFIEQIKQESDAIDLVGLSTHFATSDELDHTFFHKQLAEFDAVVKASRDAGHTIPLVHAANSGAILQKPTESAFNMVRPGIMLYGYAPSAELHELWEDLLRPPLELISSVVFRKRVKEGEGVSYNLRWHAPKDTNILTVTIGYGDGYPRALTNAVSAVIHGKYYSVVGTICMDQIMIDCGDDDIAVGARVRLISSEHEGISAWHLAKTVGTIPYEILTGIAARVPRVEKKEI
jgi:alanine racemase